VENYATHHHKDYCSQGKMGTLHPQWNRNDETDCTQWSLLIASAFGTTI
jgi:hypothetical protein